MTASSYVVARCPAEQLSDFSPFSHASHPLPNGSALLSFRLPQASLRLVEDRLELVGADPSCAIAIVRVKQAEAYSFEPAGQDAIRVTGRGVARYKLFMAGARRTLTSDRVEWRIKGTHSATLTKTPAGDLELVIKSPFLDQPERHVVGHPHPLREIMIAWGRVFRDASGLEGPQGAQA